MLSFGKVKAAIHTDEVASDRLIAVSSGLTCVAPDGSFAILMNFVAGVLKGFNSTSRSRELRILDISSSSGLLGLLFAKVGGHRAHLFSRSPYTRAILRENARRNGSSCEVLEELDPSPLYDVVITDAFEVARPDEIRFLGRLMGEEGHLVLFGFPAAYLPTLNEHFGQLEWKWVNELCMVKLSKQVLTPGGEDDFLELPPIHETDPRAELERRFEHWSGCFPPFETEPNWHIATALSTGTDRPPESDGQPIFLYPSLVYGTGSNALTRLALQVLPQACERLNPARSRVLDLGCGSGVLAIAATRLGLKQVDAMDVDASAVELARWNGELNRSPIDVLQEIDFIRRYDLIIANLFGDSHGQYLQVYHEILRPQGWILMCGFDRSREAEIRERYGASGYLAVSEHRGFGWKAIVWRRGTAAGGRGPEDAQSHTE